MKPTKYSLLGLCALGGLPIIKASTTDRPNILLITVDDMNYNSIGCFGSPVPKITPHIDQLAKEGMRFEHAFVTAAVSMPSRNVLATGLYPHNNGVEGFAYATEESSVLSIWEILQQNGYFTGCFAKLPHCFPKASLEKQQDMIVKAEDLIGGRDPEQFYRYSKEFFQKAQKAGKPFYLMANSQDPHRPFFNSPEESNKNGKSLYGDHPRPNPSYIYEESEITIPGFLPELSDIRKEITQYYNNVKRADDIIGGLLRALKESKMDKNTLVVFLSDNGMAFPFSKTNVYLNSNRTPLIIRWPKVIQPGQVEKEALINGVDFLPTILDILRIDAPYSLDGHSYKPLLEGKRYTGQPYVYTTFYANSAYKVYPMRAIQNKEYAYIYSAWSNSGDYSFTSETKTGLSYKAMQRAAKQDPTIAQRVKLFDFRVREEFYDLRNDPNALNNLINDPKHQTKVQEMRKEMEKKMIETNDHALEAFRNRYNEDAQHTYLSTQQEKFNQLKKNKGKAKGKREED